MRKEKKGLKVLAAAVAASMMFSSAALAAPIDELNEILEKQEEASETLLEKQLGLSALTDAMKENGFSAALNVVPGVGLDEELPEGAYLISNLQVDPGQKRWEYDAEGGIAQGALLDLSLYGDTEKLAFAIPQFFGEAVSIQAGSFKEQYVGSQLQGIIRQIIPDLDVPEDQIPDINLSFYPEEKDDNDLFKMKDLKEKAEALKDKMQVEKSEEGDVTVYHVTLETEDIMEIYRMIFENYLAIFTSTGLVTVDINDSFDDLQSQLDQMIDEMGSVLGDEVTMDFYVQDELLTKLAYALYIDTTALAQQAAESASEANPDGEIAIVEVSNEFKGYVNYEIVFTYPEDPMQEIVFHITMEDEQGNGTNSLELISRTDETETTSQTEVSMTLKTNEEVVYQGTPVVVSYDAAAGTLDAVLSVDAEEDSVSMNLSSAFSDVEAGKSFVWTINELSVAQNGQKLGLSAVLSLGADAGAFTEFSKEISLFQASQNELYGLIGEIGANVQNWVAQFEEETEAETTGTVSDADAAA